MGAVDDLQKKLGRLTTLETEVKKILLLGKDVAEIKQAVADFKDIGLWVRKKMEEERADIKLGKRPEEGQTSNICDEQNIETPEQFGRVEDSVNRETPAQFGRVEDSVNIMEHRFRGPDMRPLPLIRRIAMPVFDGGDPECWVTRIEQYFEHEEFEEEDKLRASRKCFDGDALLWYQREKGREPFRSWRHLRRRVLDSFVPARDRTPGEQLLRIQQLHVLDQKERNTSQTAPGRKERDQGDNNDVMNNSGEEGEDTKALASAEKEELDRLREQVNDLQKKLLEKEELLKSMEMSKNQVNEVQEKLEQTNRLVYLESGFVKNGEYLLLML